MGSLARCYYTSRPSELSLKQCTFNVVGQAAAGKGELELRELLARPDADGGKVPDIVVGSHIGPFLL